MNDGSSRKRALALAGALAFAGALVAEDPATPGGDKSDKLKPPSPTSTVQALLKGLGKAKGYKVEVDIEGGFSSDADHSVTQRTVRESYSGEVSGPLMKSSQPKSYRTAAKGVALVGGQWRAILSDPVTVKMDRLFKFPETILQRALKHARTGTWVAESAEDGGAAGEAEPADADDDSDDDAEASKPRGKTVVVGKKKDKKAAAATRLPRLLRIEASPEEALSHILEVQNSNCFGGG